MQNSTVKMELSDLPIASNDQIKSEFMDFSAEAEQIVETNISERYYADKSQEDENLENNNIFDVENSEDNSDKNTYNQWNVYRIENKCAICKMSFPFQRGLLEHAKKTHPKGKALKCQYCSSLFTSVLSTYKHLKENHPDISSAKNRREHSMPSIIYPIEDKCAACRKEFSTQRSLITHVNKSHPNDKGFKCLHCSMLFKKIIFVAPHYKATHAILPKLSFSTNSFLKSHQRVHTEQTSFPCNLCEKTFEYKLSLVQHIKTHLRDNIEQDLSDEDSSNNIEINNDRMGKMYKIKNKCAICKQKFSSQYILIRHVEETHPNGIAFICINCPTLFSNLQSTYRHFKQNHTNAPKNYTCDVCGKSFFTKSSLEMHRRAHMEVRPFSCNHCDKSFKRKSNLANHKKTHFKDKNKEYCENNEQDQFIRNDIEDNDDQNQLLNGEDNYEIDELNMSINYDYFGNPDQDEITGNEEEQKPFPFNLCEKTFGYKVSLDQHLKTHLRDNIEHDHTDEVDDVSDNIKTSSDRTAKMYKIKNKCGICKENFSSQDTLIRHVKETHPNGKAFICINCPTLFSKLKSTYGHYKRSHSNMPKNYICDDCGKSFFSNFWLQMHRRVHMEVRPFSCNQCDKSFKCKSNLGKHKKIHLKAKNKMQYQFIRDSIKHYDDNIDEDASNNIEINNDKMAKMYKIKSKCAICKEKFSHQQTLIRHVEETHPNGKAFTCLYCPALFSKLKSTYRHYKWYHTNAHRNYICGVCGKSYFSNYLLEVHRAVHVEIRSFSCSQCDKSFKFKSSLTIHRKTHFKAKNKGYCENNEQDQFIRDEIDGIDINGDQNQSFPDHYKVDNPNLLNDDGHYATDEQNISKNDDYFDYPDQDEITGNEEDQKPFPCNLCEKTFGCKVSLDQHLKTHLRDNIEQDHMDEDTSINIENLLNGDEHYVRDERNISTNDDYFANPGQDGISGTVNEKESEVSQSECIICTKEFKCKQSLDEHLKSSHPEIELFKCPYCDDNFFSQDSLSLHVTLMKH